jgi:hypothetical protein
LGEAVLKIRDILYSPCQEEKHIKKITFN